MCQILKNSYFVFNVEDDKISINYKNSKNKKYVDLIKDIEYFKIKATELIDNFEKFKKFLEKVKNYIKTKIFLMNINFELTLYENIENSNSNHKYIDCKFKINKYNNLEEEEIFIEKDILYDISLQNFNNCLENLNNIRDRKEKLQQLQIQGEFYINMKYNQQFNANNSIIEHPRYIGKMEYYIEEERNELLEIKKKDEEFEKIKVKKKTHNHKEEMKELKKDLEKNMLRLNNSSNIYKSNNEQKHKELGYDLSQNIERERNTLIEIQKQDLKFNQIIMEKLSQYEKMKELKIDLEKNMPNLNNNNNFFISNNQEKYNFEQNKKNIGKTPFYLPGEKMIISDIINILKESTINISLNSNKEFDFNIIKFRDKTFLKEINYSDFENELKNKDQKILNDAYYSNNLFDNFEKLINFIKKIQKIAEEKFKFDKFEIKLSFKEIEENNKNIIKNISCNYSLVKPIISIINNKNYFDSNILTSNNYYNFQHFLEDIEKNI